MFIQFETLSAVSSHDQSALVGQICEELNIHETVENELFYPAMTHILLKNNMLDKIMDGQDQCGYAIQALGELQPCDQGYDRKVKDLYRQIAAHAAEEENRIFPLVQNSGIDTFKLSDRIAARMAELTEKLNEPFL